MDDLKLFPIVKFFNIIKNNTLKLSNNERLVLFILAGYARNESFIAFPSIKTIALNTNLTTRTIKTILLKLTKKELIFIEKIKGKSSQYHLYPVLNQYEKLSTGGEMASLGNHKKLSTGGETISPGW